MNLDAMRLTDAQRESIGHVNGPLLLCAGAGSGKTFTLQQRIAYALSPESGPAAHGIDEILAITFTDKAASEIKSRVRTVLRAEGMIDQSLRVDSAWISTIHGMCGRVLREHALELGIDPSFVMLDSDREAELRTQAISSVLARCDDEGKGFDGLFAEYGATGSSRSVFALVNTLLTQAASLTDGLDAIRFQSSTCSKPGTLARKILTCCNDALASQPTPAQQTALEYTAALAQDFLVSDVLAAGFDESAAWDELERMVMRIERPDMRGKKAKEAIRTLHTALDEAILEINLKKGNSYAKQLMVLARMVDAEYEHLKAREGAIDMAGMLRLAMKALDEHASIAAEYRNRFKLVMVDEFQDTNQLQIDMIERICGLAKPNLCTVGDSQQSIYRFLGADVNVYMKHKRDMASPAVGAKCLELSKNFRSHADVLSFVRHVCGREGFFVEKFLDLEAGRDEESVRKKGRHFKGEGPRIGVQLTTYSQGGASRAEAKRVEAEGIARWFSQLRDAGHRAGEMVVLMGATTHANVYAQALRDAGFSCVVAGGSGFYSAPEVKLVVRALRVLANPYDTEAVYALLSSDIMALSADDFLLLATRWPSDGNEADVPKRCDLQGKLVSSKGIEHASRRLDFAYQLLHRAWDSLGCLPPSRVLRNLLVDTGYLMRKSTEGTDGQAQAANVLKAIRLVEDIESEEGFDMARVARKFEGLSAEKEKLGALSGDALDSVRLMTVHSSKGLEFPIVAVVDCYSVSERGSALEMMVADGRAYASLMTSESTLASPVSSDHQYLKRMSNPEDELGVSFAQTLAAGNSGEARAALLETRPSASELRAMLVAYRDEEALYEKRRLFYVAATRASEAMLIACTAKRNKEGIASLEPVQEDIAFGLFGCQGFPGEDGCHTFEDGYFSEAVGERSDRTWPLFFTYFNADACVLEDCPTDGLLMGRDDAGFPSGDDGEVAAGASATDYDHDEVNGDVLRMVAYPKLAQRLSRELAIEKPDETGLFSYSSMSALEVSRSDSKVWADRVVDDADKATDFGLAFHRLAQIDALAGEDNAVDSVERVARKHGVSDTGRLRAALDRWLASEVRARALSYAVVVPEQPFCIPAEGPAAVASMVNPEAMRFTHFEGAMDLFCANEYPSDGDFSKPSAFIVDYKTGGTPSETQQELYEKHLLQARSYAYAAKAAGYGSVELAFVRVEQSDFESPDQPQVVWYRF